MAPSAALDCIVLKGQFSAKNRRRGLVAKGQTNLGRMNERHKRCSGEGGTVPVLSRVFNLLGGRLVGRHGNAEW